MILVPTPARLSAWGSTQHSLTRTDSAIVVRGKQLFRANEPLCSVILNSSFISYSLRYYFNLFYPFLMYSRCVLNLFIKGKKTMSSLIIIKISPLVRLFLLTVIAMLAALCCLSLCSCLVFGCWCRVQLLW